MRKIWRKFKRFIKVLFQQDVYWKTDCQAITERFGSQYAGWAVATRGLSQDSVVYSFGVGKDISFDLELIDRFGLTIHAFDPTPKSIRWVEEQQLPSNFILYKYGLAHFDGDVSFHPPENPEHISHTILNKPSTHSTAFSVPVKKLETIMQELGHQQPNVIKMDVEGAEYEIINSLVASNIRPNQLLIEFHHRFPNISLDKTKQTISELNRIGYSLFSVSNSGEELGFIYKPS